MYWLQKNKRIFVFQQKRAKVSKVYHLEINGQHSYYTTLSGLCSDNKISKFTLDRHNFDNPYIKGDMIIRKSILRSGLKQTKAEVKTVPFIHEPINKNLPTFKNPPPPPKQTKSSIVPGTYVKRGDEYIFNLDGDIMTLDEIKILGYKTPNNSIGNISDLL